MSEQPALERLRELLRDMGGLIAALLEGAPAGAEDEPAKPGVAAQPGVVGEPSSRAASLAAGGPRAEGRREQYELLVEAIYEGYLLHYRRARVLAVSEQERELGLLAGDQLYAIGLARLVELGDTQAVAELADTISLSALAQADGRQALAEAVWHAGARAVGWGPSEAHRRAKELVYEGSPEALDAMRTSAEAGGH